MDISGQREQAKGKSGFVPYLKSKGKLIPLAIGIIIGILLIIAGGVFAKDKPEDNSKANIQTGSDVNVGAYHKISEYELAVEKKIKALCENVGGVGNVNVSVYINEGFEYIASGDSKNGYVEAIAPKISGIGIVCDGGDDIRVQQKLIMLISTTFSVGANKIFVTGT